MRLMLRTMAMAGVLAVGGLLAATSLAHAGGCCGGGGSQGFVSRAAYGAPGGQAGYSCCSPGGMAMGGMSMAAPAPTPQNGMAGMNMAAPAPPAAAVAQYYCPMHPTVVSPVPATCPY